MLELSSDLTGSEPSHSADTDSANDEATGDAHPLLEIQRLDTEAEQMQHRRATLPQRSALIAAIAERTQGKAKLDIIAANRVEVMMRHKRLEQEAAIVEAKANTDDNRLYSGEIRGIRDLQALQEEVTGLRSRQGHLEEQAITALIEADELEEAESSLRAELEACEARVTVLQAEVSSAEAEIDGQRAAALAARAEASTLLAGPMLSAYERMRRTYGPSTAVEFDPSSGCGCPNQMPAVEVARIKRCPQGAVENCSECGRLVLR